MKVVREYQQPALTPNQVGEKADRVRQVPLQRENRLSRSASPVEPIPEGIRQEIVEILAEILVLDYQDYQKVVTSTVVGGGGLNRGEVGPGQQESLGCVSR